LSRVFQEALLKAFPDEIMGAVSKIGT